MAVIDIYGLKSLTVTSEMANTNINSRTIYIGNRYVGEKFKAHCISYLYFDMSTIPADIELLSAQLVLFRIEPYTMESQGDEIGRIYPLIDYFSSYTSYVNKPRYNDALEVNFLVKQDRIYIEADLMPIVLNWIKGAVHNKGLVIMVSEHSKQFLKFGSSLNKDKNLLPLLQITFRHKTCQLPLVEIDCTYEIVPPRKE